MKIHFASGVTVEVTEVVAGRKKHAASTRFTCPGCGTVHEVVTEGGPVPGDFKFGCEVAGCAYVGPLP